MNLATDNLSPVIDQMIETQRLGFSLDKPFYSDADIFAHDMDTIFSEQWLLVDHASRIPETGDYFVFEIGSESIILVREDDTTINAFYNVCRHRGSRICLEPEGKKRFLTCPYHAWAYNLDGTLKVARSMPESFDAADYGLHKAHVREYEGFLFINLAKETPPDFDGIHAAYEPMLDFHGFSKAKIAYKQSYPTNANWKLIVENFIECYHCAPAHPEYCAVHPADQLLAYGAGPGSGPEDAEKAYGEVLAQWEEKVRAMGHETILLANDELSFAFSQASRFPINDRGALSETMDGTAACAKLMGSFKEYDGGETAMSFNPVSYVLAFNDFAVMFRYTPRGPMSTDVELTWLVHEDAEEGVDYEATRISKVWDITVQQDKTITQNNQAGILSSRYQPGPYSQHERLVSSFVRWYLNRIGSKA